MKVVWIGLCTFALLSPLWADEPIPAGFVRQVLEPTGGKIVRPKDWFYAEKHGSASYTWIFSKEDTSKGPYDTGVRIQTLVDVEEGTGQSPKTFVLHFLAEKKRTAQKILDECEPQDQGLFTRVCLETEEGPYHIAYSLFWGNDLDVVVVTIAGAKKAEWPLYAETFDRMNHFELIDMKRFEKSTAADAAK